MEPTRTSSLAEAKKRAGKVKKDLFLTCRLCKKERNTLLQEISEDIKKNFVCFPCMDALRSQGKTHSWKIFKKGLHLIQECIHCKFQHIVNSIPSVGDAFILSHPCPGEEVYLPVSDERLGIRKRKEISRKERSAKIAAFLARTNTK